MAWQKMQGWCEPSKLCLHQQCLDPQRDSECIFILLLSWTCNCFCIIVVLCTQQCYCYFGQWILMINQSIFILCYLSYFWGFTIGKNAGEVKVPFLFGNKICTVQCGIMLLLLSKAVVQFCCHQEVPTLILWPNFKFAWQSDSALHASLRCLTCVQARSMF